jgi:hypothetical protein
MFRAGRLEPFAAVPGVVSSGATLYRSPDGRGLLRATVGVGATCPGCRGRTSQSWDGSDDQTASVCLLAPAHPVPCRARRGSARPVSRACSLWRHDLLADRSSHSDAESRRERVLAGQHRRTVTCEGRANCGGRGGPRGGHRGRRGGLRVDRLGGSCHAPRRRRLRPRPRSFSCAWLTWACQSPSSSAAAASASAAAITAWIGMRPLATS